MGIQGLLPLLKSTMEPFHIKELQGCCVAVDTYSWLHKGALSCSTQLCKGLPSSRHIEYCMHRVNLLRHYGVKPILVFDGGFLPMKLDQENKRARSRKENLARALEHESNGNLAAAYECYQKAVDISPSIAHELIQVLKKENISYFVAPYEADAQMAFLAISKQVDAVITEDSDLIPFGCPRIIFKMDKYGQGVEFQNSRLRQNKELSFSGFTHGMLLQMCILSGCDYLQSLPGMGLKRAHALMTKFKSYEKVIKHLKYSTASVPPLYEESFRKAILTFQYQRVYDPTTEDIIHLSPLADTLDDLEFLGPLIPQQIAKGIAEGDLDPFTQIPFKQESSSSGVVLNQSFEIKNVKPESGRKKLDLPVQKNLLTKYFCFASLEAKRKFRAPRTSPITPSPVDKSPLSLEEDCCLEVASSNINSSPGSLFDSENMECTLPAETLENSFLADDPEFSEAPMHGLVGEKGSSEGTFPIQLGDSTPDACQALLKECDGKSILVSSVTSDEKDTENEKVVVQSSLFKHKTAKNIYEDDRTEKVLLKNDASSVPCDNIVLKSSYKTRTADKKIIVRSSYFQHKSETKNGQHNLNERLQVEDDEATATVRNENIILEGASKYNSSAMKRKTCPNDVVQLKKNMKQKQMRENGSFSENGVHAPNVDEALAETTAEEGKFGSNISHLSLYTDIAEKSMERFVSVISSFKFSSSGSRASGLRAPLKDIRNTCTSRSNIDADMSRFAYIPKDKLGG